MMRSWAPWSFRRCRLQYWNKRRTHGRQRALPSHANCEHFCTEQQSDTDGVACYVTITPIEHVWDTLGRRVRDNHPPPGTVYIQTFENTTRDILFCQLQQEWQQISQADLRRLIGSMHRRCLACMHSNGGHTRF